MSPVSHIKFWDLSFLLGPILRTAVELYNQCVPRCMTGWVAVTRLCTGMLHEGFKYWPRMLAGVCEGIYGVWWPLKKVLCALVLVLWGMQDTGGELSKVHDTNPESCSCGAGDLHQCGVHSHSLSPSALGWAHLFHRVSLTLLIAIPAGANPCFSEPTLACCSIKGIWKWKIQNH